MIKTDQLSNELLPAVHLILEQKDALNSKLLSICKLLNNKVDGFDWVGFYMANPNGKEELILGPYVGAPTDHTVIPFGVGICGQVAVSNQTFVSQNVHAEDNYLACSTEVNSEIVAPIMKNGKFIAQLDIDSHQTNSITPEKRNLVEQICNLLSNEF